MKLRKILALALALTMIFALAACGGGTTEPTTPAPAPVTPAPAPEAEVLSWWEGNWYGWWTIFDGDGDYYDLVNEAWDCCVCIEPMEDGHLISIWDEDFNDYDGKCLAEVKVEINPDGGDGPYGEAVSVTDSRNYFWKGAVEQGDWTIDPVYAGVDNMLIIEGSYIDDNGDYCEYGVVLTKWGYEWNEAESTYAPDNYYNYFLPLMDDGVELLPPVFEP